jgi:integrase
VKVLLNHWRALGLTPELSKDTISDALKRLPVPREEAAFLRPRDISLLLKAALLHDRVVYAETREEHSGMRPKGTTPRYSPIAPLVMFLLLSGCRRGEALGLRWADVDLDAMDHQARRVGEIRLRAEATKTKHARVIGLEVSPALRRLLAALKLRATEGDVFVFGGEGRYTHDLIESARARLMEEFEAPAFTWQVLRSSCATYLTNAPGIWGAATVFLSARQLGHSVAVAERHYLGVHRGIRREARTLEAAMEAEHAIKQVVDGVSRCPMDDETLDVAQ